MPVRTYVEPVKNICHIELVNPLSKCTLLVIGYIQDGLSLQETCCSSQELKPCKSVQETSEEVLYFKARQIARQIVSIEV